MDDRTLLLMRHAEAGYSLSTSDADRDLTEEGVADARVAGAWVAERVGALDVVVTSGAVRTQRTWAVMADAGASASHEVDEQAIYSGGVDALLQVVRAVDADARRVLVIGHAPDIPRLARHLVGRSVNEAAARQLGAGFPTSTIVELAVPTPWADVVDDSATLLDAATLRA
ncbi:histidine phosphatase family protein [Nigerium sp.]|uniref:SixA phosphatase family protein n=1 Tax=Nigerium sp. TaxID=2042655 RepID=UPI003221D45D